jgi:hypothetical protein
MGGGGVTGSHLDLNLYHFFCTSEYAKKYYKEYSDVFLSNKCSRGWNIWRDHKEALGKDGKIILEWISGKLGGVYCEQCNEPLGSIKGKELND